MSFPVRRPFQRISTSRGKKWREGAVLCMLLVVSVTLQGAVSSGIIWAAFRPDLVLIVVIYWSLRKGGWRSVVVGMIGGLLKDVFSFGKLGLGAITLALTAGAVVLVCRSLYREHLSTKLVMVGIACLVSSFLYYLLAAVFSTLSLPPWPLAWKQVIWPHLWQTTLVAPLWLWVAAKLLK